MELVDLSNLIEDKGVKKTVLASKLGMSYSTLLNKLQGKSEFTVRQAMALSDMLSINESDYAFYFSQKVAKGD